MKDEPKTCLADGSPVAPDHQEINPRTGMQKGYVVLCPEERAKGFVRPVRRSYKHVGKKTKYPLRDLTADEKARFGGSGYVKFEDYPESEAPKSGRFWTQAELDGGCGTVTTMSQPLAETYARDPKFYSGTFCCGCGSHFPVEEFVWIDDGTVVGS
jgi:hypothetical protein